MVTGDRRWFIIKQLVGSSAWTDRIAVLAGCASPSPLRMREVFSSDVRDVLLVSQEAVLVVEPRPGNRLGPGAARRAAKGDPSGLGTVRVVPKADVAGFSILPNAAAVPGAGGTLATAVVTVRPGVPGGDIHFVADTSLIPVQGITANVHAWLARPTPATPQVVPARTHPPRRRRHRLIFAGSALAVAVAAAIIVLTVLVGGQAPAADTNAGHEVPDIVGQRLDMALRAVPEQLLTRQVDSYSDTLPAGYVSAVDPLPGTAVTAGSTVTLWVTLGPFPVHVPDVVGQPVAVAEELLERAGFTDLRVERRSSMQPPEIVLRQSPSAGAGLPSANQEITLVVSNGPGS